jgi:Fic family protein
MSNYKIPILPLSVDVETKEILKQLNKANRQLAELKGIAQTIPNESILINSLTLQEAKDSSAVENIVTTHDELYKADLDVENYIMSASTKEVLNYRQAIQTGFSLVRKNKLLTNNILKQIQEVLEGNKAGFRTVPGTTLKDGSGNVVYTPPQDSAEVKEMMANLEQFINNEDLTDLDPLIKVVIIHHQFESIHPFYDGNGRTGRILVILYLVTNDLLDLPILYLSRYITHNKSEYYRLLQAIRENKKNEKDWQNWVLFVLKGIEETAKDTILLVKGISN